MDRNSSEHAFSDEARSFFVTHRAMIDNIAQQLEGAVSLYCRMNKLEGPWTLSDDGSKLILPDDPKPVPMPELPKEKTG